ncbi:MAG: YebC/PmpR family DNA-binding transcriptional regulator [Thermoanaerobaculia bacterium]|jgi:YebC/PmpR family DNA-binding regulatory protein
MSGHSKWATIKRKKGALDAKRGKIFTRIIRELTISARMGGGDPTGNPRLRAAIDEAKAANMPKDNIERAVKKGSGGLEGSQFDELTYEGYGPAGVALMVEVMTDNTNRTTPEIRKIFEKCGGNFGSPGSVRFQFDKKGWFQIEKSAVGEDKLMEIVLEAGADDLDSSDPETFEVIVQPEAFQGVRDAIDGAKIPVVEAKVGMLPNIWVKVDDENKAKQLLRLVEMLDDHDDVQNVWSNFDIPEEILSRLE